MSGVPYIRFYGDDWLSGTQELSLEERGTLITLVALTATTGEPPVADYSRLGRRFGCTPGKAKKLINSLIEAGKISLENRAIKNKRALFETRNSQKFSQKQSEKANERWSKNNEKDNENNGGDSAVAYAVGDALPEPKPNKTPLTPQGGGRRVGVSDEVKALVGVIR